MPVSPRTVLVHMLAEKTRTKLQQGNSCIFLIKIFKNYTKWLVKIPPDSTLGEKSFYLQKFKMADIKIEIAITSVFYKIETIFVLVNYSFWRQGLSGDSHYICTVWLDRRPKNEYIKIDSKL